MNEKELNKKAEEIYELQRKIDELMNEIYLEDELFGSWVTEVLNENLY
jgi:peptidoglycan hydrolase CwlO-like protein